MRPEHVSELSFANDKLEKRRLQALREGILLSDEYDASDKLAADQQLETIIDEAGKREKSYKRIQRNLRGSAMPTKAELRGTHVFVASDCRTCVPRLRSFSLILVHDVKLADVIIVSELSVALSDAVKYAHFWFAGFKGLRLLTAEAVGWGEISNNGQSLCCLRALRLKRELFISHAFRTDHPNLACLISSVASAEWQILADEAAYLHAKATSKSIVIALVKEHEKTLMHSEPRSMFLLCWNSTILCIKQMHVLQACERFGSVRLLAHFRVCFLHVVYVDMRTALLVDHQNRKQTGIEL